MRALTAPPTRVTFTQTTVDREIDRLWLRVQLRAAALGLTTWELAQRMGINRARLYKACSGRHITRAMFQRLCKALEGIAPGASPLVMWWEAPLPPMPKRITAEKVREAVRRKIR